MDKVVKIFPTPVDLAKAFAEEMAELINASSKNGKLFTVALSGGSTPEILFTILAESFAETIPWKFVHIFWGDERCVHPDDPESNFGMTMKKLLGKIKIPSVNIHRIKGEADPDKEAFRYSEEVKKYTRSRNMMPCFDLIILGLGEDGHTASIFPDHLELFESDKICEAAVHPISSQRRITLTGKVINNADNVSFLVTGKKKAAIVEKMFKNSPVALNYPAAHVVPVYGRLEWMLDKDSGSLIE